MGVGGSREREYEVYERYVPGEVFCVVKEGCVVNAPSRLYDELQRGVLWKVTHTDPALKAVRNLGPYEAGLAEWASSASVIGLRDLSSIKERLKVLVRVDGRVLRIFAPEDSFHAAVDIEGESGLLRTELNNVHIDWYRTDDLMREIFHAHG